MKVSILLPSLFPDLANSAIEALRPQLRGVDHEFVVVSPISFSGENIRWIQETERRGAVAAMQTAAEHATGDLLLITSDDFRFSDNAIAEALAAFADPARPFPMALTYPHRMRAIDCVFATFGRLATSVCAVGKADALHAGGAHDRAFRIAFGDTDLGMRIMAAGGTVRRARARVQELTDRMG
ncbi:MAG: glycosyltransferase family 2 protein, partial [Tagaea sp.]